METRLSFEIHRQPDHLTCGPTCLHAVYRFFGDGIRLEQVIQEAPMLDEGGTLAVLLGCHARKRGYDARLYTYNLQTFDPTWFHEGAPPMSDRLTRQMALKPGRRMQIASKGYVEFLESGGEIRMQDLTGALIRKYLQRELPVLAGLSATYLYDEKREVGRESLPDDVQGMPAGHFVVLCGYDSEERTVLVADPLFPNPMAKDHFYVVGLDRVVCAILLGVMTEDANLLIIQPPGRSKRRGRADSHSHQ